MIDGRENTIVKNAELNRTLLKSWLLESIAPSATLLNYGKCLLPIIVMRSKISLIFVKSHLDCLLIWLAVKEVLVHRMELRML